MPKEYIEREAVREVLRNPAVRGMLFTEYELDEIPPADAVEVVHAKWEDEYGGKYANKKYRCSHCKEKALYKYEREVLGDWIEVQALTDYCPNCGAKMDLED